MDLEKLPQDLQGLVEYHNHLCPGVLIGYKVCKYAMDIIGESDNLAVVTEKNNCASDAIRFLLDCTEENHKLSCRNGKEMAWAFYNYDAEEGVKISLNPDFSEQLPKDRDAAVNLLLELPNNILLSAEPYNHAG